MATAADGGWPRGRHPPPSPAGCCRHNQRAPPPLGTALGSSEPDACRLVVSSSGRNGGLLGASGALGRARAPRSQPLVPFRFLCKHRAMPDQDMGLDSLFADTDCEEKGPSDQFLAGHGEADPVATLIAIHHLVQPATPRRQASSVTPRATSAGLPSCGSQDAVSPSAPMPVTPDPRQDRNADGSDTANLKWYMGLEPSDADMCPPDGPDDALVEQTAAV